MTEQPDDEPTRVWTPISCSERDNLWDATELRCLASRTDEHGRFGDPEIFTEWGDPATDRPVLRDHRYPPRHPHHHDPNDPPLPDARPCEHYRLEETP